MLDLDSIADVVAGAVCEATAPLIAENKAMAERIASLETRQLPAAIKGDPGEVDMEAVKAILSDLVSAAFATMPVPKDGESVDPAVIKQMVDEAIAALPAPVPAEPDAAAIESAVDASVTRAVAALPVPKDGESVDPVIVKQMVDEAIAALPAPVPVEPDASMIESTVDARVVRAVAALPVPKDGESVDPAVIKQMVDEAIAALPAPVPAEPDAAAIENAVDASVARAVSALRVPKDGDNGIGLADALIDRGGNLVLTMTDGRTKELGRVIGKDGTNALPAVPFTLNDFDIVQGDDDRTFKFCFTHGDVMHSFEFEFPVIIYRDVWKQGPYARGDAVTWAGSLWIAQRATDGKPDTPDSGWRLAVKKGRDGKDK